MEKVTFGELEFELNYEDANMLYLHAKIIKSSLNNKGFTVTKWVDLFIQQLLTNGKIEIAKKLVAKFPELLNILRKRIKSEHKNITISLLEDVSTFVINQI